MINAFYVLRLLRWIAEIFKGVASKLCALYRCTVVPKNVYMIWGKMSFMHYFAADFTADCIMYEDKKNPVLPQNGHAQFIH